MRLALILLTVIMLFTCILPAASAQNQTDVEAPDESALRRDEFAFTYRVSSPLYMDFFCVYPTDIKVEVKATGLSHSVYTVDKNPASNTATVVVRLDDPDIYQVKIVIHYQQELTQTISWGLFEGAAKRPAGGADSLVAVGKDLTILFRIIADPEPHIPTAEEQISTFSPVLKEQLEPLP